MNTKINPTTNSSASPIIISSLLACYGLNLITLIPLMSAMYMSIIFHKQIKELNYP
jgi:hypothetical protein